MIALVQIEIWITNSAVTFPISKSNRLTTTFPSFSRHGPPSCPLLSLLYFTLYIDIANISGKNKPYPKSRYNRGVPDSKVISNIDLTHIRSVSLIWDAKRLVSTNFLSVYILFRTNMNSFPRKHSKRVESVQTSIYPKLVAKMLSTWEYDVIPTMSSESTVHPHSPVLMFRNVVLCRSWSSSNGYARCFWKGNSLVCALLRVA